MRFSRSNALYAGTGGRSHSLASPDNVFNCKKIGRHDMLPLNLAPNLTKSADAAIIKVLTNGGARTSKPSGEVSAVRTLTLDGFDEIAASWSPILNAYGLRIKLRAVFCHSRPHVTFPQVPHPNYKKAPAVRRCELADLLIVMDHIDPFRQIDDRRAVLVQAKILKAGSLALSGKRVDSARASRLASPLQLP
jgi:hypothetical protein